MGENTKIEWAHHTANFWIGCTETKLTVGKLKSWDKKAAAAGERHRVFVNSLADICDTYVPQEWREQVIDAALATPSLDYLLLTKRAQNYSKMFDVTPSNMWAGTTVGVKKSLARIDHLRKTDFRVKFLSIEPLLEDLGELDLTGIHWVIVGGESGRGARPMHLDWAWSIRDQCVAKNVPFFFKQGSQANWRDYKDFDLFPSHLQVRELPR